MNSEISEIIKDLSEAFLFVVSAITMIMKAKKSNKPRKKRRG